MGVLAYKIVDFGGGDVVTLTNEFECGSFDLADENSGLDGWVEISRDCDHWPATRRTLTPYASGNRGSSALLTNFDDRIKFQKYFANTSDSVLDVLDLSDMNGGFLPSLLWFVVHQNGKRLVEPNAYTVDYDTKELTIAAALQVPGAAYHVEFHAPLAGV